jgi:hypothetical protein
MFFSYPSYDYWRPARAASFRLDVGLHLRSGGRLISQSACRRRELAARLQANEVVEPWKNSSCIPGETP